jgi:hypothetical protein
MIIKRKNTLEPKVKFNLKIGNKSVPVDKIFLDAVALAHFGCKYEDASIRKKSNAIIRCLMANESVFHPQIVHKNILISFLPPSIKKQILE